MSYRQELKEYVKEETKQESRKLKEMSWSDRFWYIWEYYKWHMLIFAVILMMLSAVATSIYNSTLKTQLYCVIVNNPMTQRENFDFMTEGFADYMQFGKKDRIYVESLMIPTDGSFDDLALATQGKLSALIAAKELDIMICDSVMFQRYADMDGYMDMETLLPPDLLEQVRDKLLYAKNQSGQTIAYGIDITGNWYLQNLGVVTDPACFAVITNAPHPDNCVALLRLMFQEQGQPQAQTPES